MAGNFPCWHRVISTRLLANQRSEFTNAILYRLLTSSSYKLPFSRSRNRSKSATGFYRHQSFTHIAVQLVIVKEYELWNIYFSVCKDLSKAGVLGENSYDTCGGSKLLRVAESSTKRRCTLYSPSLIFSQFFKQLHSRSGRSALFLMLLNWTIFLQKNKFRESVVECLQIMLRVDEYRTTFIETDGVTRLGKP